MSVRKPPKGRFASTAAVRLKERAEYRLTYDQGRRFGGRYFLCFLRERDASGPCRLGVTVTKRVGKAVKRNRLKRVTREFFRLRQPRMRPGLDVVVNPRPEAVAQPTRALWDDLERAFLKAGVLNGPPALSRKAPRSN